MEIQLNQNKEFIVNGPGLREPLHIKNIEDDKLVFLILKHSIYHNSYLLFNGILIIKQPKLNADKFIIFKDILQLIQSKFGTAVYLVC